MVMGECGTYGPDWEQHGEWQALLELCGCSRLDFNLKLMDTVEASSTINSNTDRKMKITKTRLS